MGGREDPLGMALFIVRTNLKLLRISQPSGKMTGDKDAQFETDFTLIRAGEILGVFREQGISSCILPHVDIILVAVG